MTSNRILFVTRNLPPLVGGMERLCWHIIDELNCENKLHVIGPKGCRKLLPSDILTKEVPIRPLWRFFLVIALTSLQKAISIRPRLIFAGSGLVAPFVWFAARLTNANCILYLHGLDVEARHPIYRLFWRRCFKYFDDILVNSQFTYKLAVQAGISPERINILNPGVQLPDIRAAKNQALAFRQHYSLGEAPVLLYVGRITARKGLLYFIRNIFPSVIGELPHTRLVVIGEEPRKALSKITDEYQQITHTLNNMHLYQSILFLGKRSHDDPELDAAYFSADALIFPVQEQKNDNEGFGMVAIEAAAHGLPTVAFAVGGVPDAVADGVSGRLIKPGHNQEFADALICYLTSKGSYEKNCRDYAENFSWSIFGKRLRSLCHHDDDR